MFVAIVIATLVAMDPSGSTPLPRVTHTRTLSAIAQRIVSDARRSSPTIESMIAEIEHTDVIVYIGADIFNSSMDAGATELASVSPTARFLRVTINLELDRGRRTEILGHELQHVLEVARAPDVRDDAGMQRLFHRIGWVSRALKYETAAALEVERAVHRELWHLRTTASPH